METSMPRSRGGQDLTRAQPGGSTTASKIAAESPLASDNAADDGFAELDRSAVTGHDQASPEPRRKPRG
jgi:hypothetical protein